MTWIKKTHDCLHCGKTLPGRAGHYCNDNDECLAAKQRKKRANEKAWNMKHKPWRQRSYENSAKEKKPKEKPKKLRYCQYKYCRQKKVPLPQGYMFYHPKCHIRVYESEGRGISTELGI